jgi:hypothetical protein
MARTLTARYGGYCRRCSSRYPAGTEITDAHGGWSHVHCPTRPAAGRISAPRSAASAASAAVRTNGKAANCDRCETYLPAGKGRLYRCLGSSSGCFKHFDREDGGWHVECLDRDACDARRAEARREAEERHARAKAREAAARRLRDLIVRPETYDLAATADGGTTHALDAITTVYVGATRTVWYEHCNGDSDSWVVPTTDEIRELAKAAQTVVR